MVLILVALTVVVLSRNHGSPTTTSSTTSSSTTTSTSLPKHFPTAVGSITMTITEPASGAMSARSLVTTVRYPTSGAPGGPNIAGATPLRSAGPYPLVVFSQGFDVTPESYARLLNSWAAAGYVVADPAYPYTSPNSPGGVVESDIVHHPADLSFVITTLLNDRALSGLIESNEIAVIGHSDGGDVSLAAVANTCCRDARVKAAVLLSGAELSWFKGSYFTSASVPLLVVQGTNDLSLNPVSCSVDLYNQAPQPKYYLSMIGQTHFSAYAPPGRALNVVTRVTINFLNGYLRNSTSARTAMTTAGSVPGLATLTSQPSLPVVAGSCPDAPTG